MYVRVGSEVVWLQVFDTGGNPDLDRLRSQWCAMGSAFIIVFNCTSRDSFHKARLLEQEIAKHKMKGYPLALVATQTDLRHDITWQEGRNMAKLLGAEYFHVSAKNTEEVNAPFEYIARRMVDVGTIDASKPENGASNNSKPISKTWTWSTVHTDMNGWAKSAIGKCVGWS